MLTTICISIALSGTTFAPEMIPQDAPPTKQQTDDATKQDAPKDDATKQDAADILGGPTVKDGDSAQGDPAFGGGGARGNNRGVVVPFDRWLRVLGGLSLTLDQQAEIETLANTYRQATREHNAKFGLEQRRLQQESRRLQQQGTDVPRELQQRIQEIRRAVPQAQEYQEKIWNVLTMDQADQARKQLQVVREDMARRRQQQQQRRRAMDARRGDDDAMMDIMVDDAVNRELDANRMDQSGDAMAFTWENSGLDEASLRRLAFLLKHQRSTKDDGPRRDR